jgi:hypothetical protein
MAQDGVTQISMMLVPSFMHRPISQFVSVVLRQNDEYMHVNRRAANNTLLNINLKKYSSFRAKSYLLI